MFSETARSQFVQLVQQSQAERTNVRKLVFEGRKQQAEPDPNRLRRFKARKITKVLPAGAESLQGPTIDLQGSFFLPEGAQIRRAIAYVEVNTPQAAEVGTGFMVSPQLFLTCQHVIRDINAARGTQITFDREMDENGRPCATTTFLLEPDRFALFSDELQLDYALIAVGNSNAGVGSLRDFGCCALSDSPDKHVIGMNVNIIQHPRGWPKMISVRNNLLTFRTNTTLLYETDTDEGSSGSPVLNDEWDLIALHHWGQPFLEKVDEHGNPIPSTVNEGVRISAICRDLMTRLPSLPLTQQELLQEVFAKPSASGGAGPTLSPPHAHPSDSEGKLVAATKGELMKQPSSNNEFSFTVPLEITVRLGGTAAPAAVEVESKAVDGRARVLTRGAEALHIDTNYQNRSGYVEDFIQDHTLPLPEPTGTLANKVAPLRPTEPNAANGLLKYEHFSIKMYKSKRMAIFTATNIDGETYLTVDRDTGLVSNSESETWFKDPRISESFCLNQPFFSEWSIYFDRGHLTRRTDPTWGTETTAERANADTYHFTNCSPQHFRFNQTTKYWQGAERYILENGLFAADTRKHLCVFQGPIFNNQIDHWADDIQIPSSFFKIVVWRGSNGLKSVGLIVDQLSLLGETRVNLGPPHDVPFVDVSQWRVAISQIETRTKLDFGEEVRNADTIAGDQPLVGGEAARPIRSFADLLA